MGSLEKLNKVSKQYPEILSNLQLRLEELFSIDSGVDYIRFYDCLNALAKGKLDDEKFKDFCECKNACSYWRKIKEVLEVAEYLHKSPKSINC